MNNFSYLSVGYVVLRFFFVFFVCFLFVCGSMHVRLPNEMEVKIKMLRHMATNKERQKDDDSLNKLDENWFLNDFNLFA